MGGQHFPLVISICVCRLYPDEMRHSVHGQWRGCGNEALKKCRKEMPEIHEEKNLATWGSHVPDDSILDRRFLIEVNREFCKRRVMHRLIMIEVHHC